MESGILKRLHISIILQRNSWRKLVARSLLALFSLFIVLSFWQAPIVNSGKAQTQELRGVWITNYGSALMYYTTRLDEVVANIAKYRLNTIYPAVWNRGVTLHPSPIKNRATKSKLEPLNRLPLLPFTDILSGLVKQAHRQHLRLIPWFEYGLMLPTNSAIARSHPDWLTKTQKGAKRANEGWLNPNHPEVQQFLTDLIVDVVKRYPVDGIQLDDHFGLPVEFGYDPYTIELYSKQHRGTKPPTNPRDAEWMAWRAKNITQLMSKITKGVKAVRPQAVVSLSPNAPDFAYTNYLQDWRRWVELDLLDEVIVQVYRDNLTNFKSVLYDGGFRYLRQKVPVSIGLYTGPFLAAKRVERSQKEVEAVRAANYQGVSFFSWETTFWIFKGSGDGQVKQSFNKLFSKPSNPK